MNIEQLYQIAARKGRVFVDAGAVHQFVLGKDRGIHASTLIYQAMSGRDDEVDRMLPHLHDTAADAERADERNRIVIGLQASLWRCTDSQLAAVAEAIGSPNDDEKGREFIGFALMRDCARRALDDATAAKLAADEAAVEARMRIAACDARDRDLAIRERAVTQHEEAVRQQWARVAGPYSTGIDEAIAVGRVVMHLARVAGGGVDRAPAPSVEPGCGPEEEVRS